MRNMTDVITRHPLWASLGVVIAEQSTRAVALPSPKIKSASTSLFFVSPEYDEHLNMLRKYRARIIS